MAKLLDWAGSEQRLADSMNPFALVTQAHLATRATRHDMAARKAAKWALVKALYQRGYERQRVLDLYAVLDWKLWLPKALQQAFRHDHDQLEEASKMRYITSNERLAKEEGYEQGILQGTQQGRYEGQAQMLEKLLVKRFGVLPDWVKPKLEAATEYELEAWAETVLSADSILAVFGNPVQ